MSSKYRLFRFLVTLMSLIISIGLIRAIWQQRGRWSLVEDRQAVLELEQKKHEELLRRLEEATGSAFIEREARDKLGLARPGDTIVLIGQSEASGSAGVESTDARSNLEKWWGLFF